MKGWQQKIEFLLGVADAWQLPPDNGCEVVFAGRSNVGKSSVLNAICQRKSLARTSKTPGRTRELNFFRIDETHFLVDLPGYGYASVDQAMKKKWAKLLDNYLNYRESLKGLILIMDIRHPMSDFDSQMLEYCAESQLQTHVLLNKADKLSRSAANKVLFGLQKELADYPVTLQCFSALKKTGIEEATQQIEQWLFRDSVD